MENMVYMFQCPQGDTVYTDNPKLRGSVIEIVSKIYGLVC
jgi:hypothetical protein